MGRERAAALEPSADLPAVHRALEDTAAARRALGTAGPPPWESIPDVRPLLALARAPGAVADGPDLLPLIPVLEAAARLAAYGRQILPVAPGPGAALAGLPRPPGLAERLRRSLDEEGQVRDEASRELLRARQRLRDLRRELVRRLEGFFQRPGADALFQERFVTIRNGRYVLPVVAAARGRLRGIVHDRSQSGATIFVEPEEVVEANNDLVQAERDEHAEVRRVLEALTEAVRAVLPELAALVDDLGRLDLVFGRGELAERMEAVAPVVEEGRAVALRGARHPLLLAQSWRRPDRPVVPVDLELTPERPLLVITGPNAGGKTVALKTLALSCLMAQAGLHVPAGAARLPCLARLFAIIGDEQSVAENLSTFSAFVRQLREVLDGADARSLVLLDELGAGTDPDDGAALAQAILEELATRGCLVVASTHLEPLKAFAASFPPARNASVEFDLERLEPTFRLLYDRPGQSYALAIGARLGLPPALIERAREHRTAHGRRLEELLAGLAARERDEAARAEALRRREDEAAALLARARQEREAAAAEARERLARARAEAQRLVADARRAVNEEREALLRQERSRERLDRASRRLAEVARAAAAPGEPAHPPGEPPGPGAQVQVPHLGLRGQVLAVDGEQATVRAGTVTVKLPLSALAPAAGGPAAGPGRRGRRGAGPGGVSGPRKEGVATELHLIGRTTDEARDLLAKYLDDAFLAGLPAVRIVHGKGTGALRRAVVDLLEAHPLVAGHRGGAPHEGGAGATVAELRIA
jgi:DNA mismatch repair protein MutS2